jgi:hypothetical protein
VVFNGALSWEGVAVSQTLSAGVDYVIAICNNDGSGQRCSRTSGWSGYNYKVDDASDCNATWATSGTGADNRFNAYVTYTVVGGDAPTRRRLRMLKQLGVVDWDEIMKPIYEEKFEVAQQPLLGEFLREIKETRKEVNEIKDAIEK